ncbi:hypothetical protein ACLB2K_059709 [Fragaria x ananassa]
MAFEIPCSSFTIKVAVLLFIFGSCSLICDAQLTLGFYAKTCPNLKTIVRNAMLEAILREPRMGASILRLHFHDCFVNGCEASVLLDDTATFTGEKTAEPNLNSIRGFEVIDTIKQRVEAACSSTVSCADILTLAARDGVDLLGGPYWEVPLGRRDARNASRSDANAQIPSPFSDIATLTANFGSKGLDAEDMTVLVGAHSIGYARCASFRSHIYKDTNIDPLFASTRRIICPRADGDNNIAAFDNSVITFDNDYYRGLVDRHGLLHSDQEFFNNGTQDGLVRNYSKDNNAWRKDFVESIVKMGNMNVLTGTNGEIRKNCRLRN